MAITDKQRIDFLARQKFTRWVGYETENGYCVCLFLKMVICGLKLIGLSRSPPNKAPRRTGLIRARSVAVGWEVKGLAMSAGIFAPPLKPNPFCEEIKKLEIQITPNIL